jgi:hypothetical protein
LTVHPAPTAWLATPVSRSSSHTVDRASGAGQDTSTRMVAVARSPSAYRTVSVAVNVPGRA